MILTPQQSNALEKIKSFIQSDEKVFILKGYAGTGKTTMIRSIIDNVDLEERQLLLMAPTGRAAKILRDKTNIPDACTIHSGIYSLDQMVVEQEDDDVELTNVPIFFPLNEEKAYNDNWLCIIDEASMVSSKKSGSDDLFFGSGVLLEDIMTFANTNNSSKVIFIGDPAQLPPVGDNDSQALKPEWFKERGYKVSTAELTDIIRQQEDSAILQNSLKIRNLLETDIRNELIFEKKEGEVIDVSISEMIDIFTENWRNGDKGAIITYKNSDALSINKIVRHKLGLPRDIITIGDRMLVVSNNGKYFNGDMVTISDILSDIEEISVTLKDKINGVVQSREVRLQFLDVKLTNEEGETHSEKLFINLINTANPYPTKDQLRALYIYFCIRYNKKNKDEIKREIASDPYYNALRVKFGYCITGHKSQGGEWQTAFVDFESRTQLDNDSLRWLYTVTTRAKSCLYGVGVPAISPIGKFSFVPQITKINKAPVNFYCNNGYKNLPETPFHNETAPVFLKLKYWGVAHALEDIDTQITDVKSIDWKEIYTIEGKQYEAYYGGGGIFRRFTGVEQYNPAILEVLNNASILRPRFEYNTESAPLKNFYNIMLGLCENLDITIVNVFQSTPYSVKYCLITAPNEYAAMEAWYNSRGQFTKAQCWSSLGSEDTKIVALMQSEFKWIE